MRAKQKMHTRPAVESLEGRRLTASMAGGFTAVAPTAYVAKDKTPPPPKPQPNPGPTIDIKLEDALISSYS